MTRFCSIVYILIFSLATLSIAEERTEVRVILSNGDRISGTLVSENEEFVEVKSDYAGVVRLTKSLVAEIERSTTDEVATVEEQKNVEEIVGEKVDPSPVAQPVSEISKPTFLSGLRIDFLEKWKKRLEFGATTQSGRKEKSDLAFRYKMQRKKGADRYLAESRFLYGKTNNSVSTDKLSSNFRWRHDFAPGVFYESNTSYSSDGVKGINYIMDQKFGLGYRFIDSEMMSFSSGLGGTLRLRDDLIRNRVREELVDLTQDWEYHFNEKIKFAQDMRFAMLLDDADAYEFEFRASLVSRLTKAINVTLRYEFEFDNSLSKALREDRRFTSSLGYDF